MAVTTVTSTQAFNTGFRAWVEVTHGLVAATTGILADVQLHWDATEADYVGPDGIGPAPTLVSATLGSATWVGVAIPSGGSADFGVILQCIDVATGTTTVTGIAAEQGSKTRHSSQDDWDCDTPPASGAPT